MINFYSCRLGEKNFTGTYDMHIDRAEFANTKNLKEVVEIKRSTMAELPRHFFSDFPKVDFLYIKEIKGLKPINQDFFKHAPSITKLWIQGSEFRTIFKLTFKNTPNVEYLSLPYNQITSFEEGSLDDIPKLKGLFLKANHITFLHKSLFRSSKDLEELDLQGNKLEALDFSLIQNPKIINLLFELNQIELIDPIFFYKKTFLNYLGLKENACVNKNFDGIHGSVYKVKKELENCFLNYKNLTNEIYLLINELEAKIYEGERNQSSDNGESVTLLIILQSAVLVVTMIGLCIYVALRNNSDDFSI